MRREHAESRGTRQKPGRVIRKAKVETANSEMWSGARVVAQCING